MTVRRIMIYPKDKVLRKKSRPVEEFDRKLSLLLDDMAKTMYRANGVGLAAPQVGRLLRVAVIDAGTGLLKLVNPEIIAAEGEQQEEEGCLSIPGIRGIVKRPAKVKVKAYNEKGELFEEEGNGLLARAFCHEIDHLDGVLFIDKMMREAW